MRTAIILLTVLAGLITAGTYDNIKAQIKALADQGSNGEGSSGNSKWVPDEIYYQTHYMNGKKKGVALSDEEYYATHDANGNRIDTGNWMPDDEYYKTHYKNGKKKGFLGKMFGSVVAKVKGLLPLGKKKKNEQPAPITLNDYTQENHLHLHRDDHFHRESHQHNDYNRNLVLDGHYPSYYDYYRRLKRDTVAKKTSDRQIWFGGNSGRVKRELPGKDKTPKKKADRATIVFFK